MENIVSELKKELKEKDKIIFNLKNKIKVLENEKENLENNFNESTNLLINKLKDIEQKYNVNLENKRPETGYLLSNINDNHNIIEEEIIINYIDCDNCQKKINENDISKHIIVCYRNLLKCKVCGEIITKSTKEKHIFDWINKNFLNDLLLKEDFEKIKISLNHGFNINEQFENLYGYSLIHFLIEKNKITEVIYYLNNYEFNYNLEDLYGNTIFHLICKNNNKVIFDEIINKVKNFNYDNCDLEKKNFKGETIIMISLEKNDIEMLKLILSWKNKGFKFNYQIKNNSNLTIMQMVHNSNNNELLNLFLNKGELIKDTIVKNFKIKKKTKILK